MSFITVHDLFNIELPAMLLANPKANELNSSFLFRITGEGGGVWTVDLSDIPTCKPIESAAQCTLEASDADFKTMLNNPAIGVQLFFQGKLKIKGDPMLVTKLQKLFSY